MRDPRTAPGLTLEIPPGVCEACGGPPRRGHDRKMPHVLRAAVGQLVRERYVPIPLLFSPVVRGRGEAVFHPARLPRHLHSSVAGVARDVAEDLALDRADDRDFGGYELRWILKAYDLAHASGAPFNLCWEQVASSAGLLHACPHWWRPLWAIEREPAEVQRITNNQRARELRDFFKRAYGPGPRYWIVGDRR